ncbi:MAG TPA: NIPSNAP family protein [Pirellulales bacterium]|nr:NIPSNAP family protein [Pirellulales bacterium]
MKLNLRAAASGQLAIVAGLIIAVGATAAVWLQSARAADASKHRVFELRTYTTAEGRLDALHKRFRDQTNKFFAKHGMEIIGFWTPADGAAAKNTLVYMLAFPSREAAEKSWKDFQADPGWKAAKEESEKDGKIVEKVVSVFLNPTDFSPLK